MSGLRLFWKFLQVAPLSESSRFLIDKMGREKSIPHRVMMKKLETNNR
jgi:hypothetical protein